MQACGVAQTEWAAERRQPPHFSELQDQQLQQASYTYTPVTRDSTKPAHTIMPPRKKAALPKPSEKGPQPPPPNWPPLKPLLPTSSLSLTTLVPSQIMLIRNFWTSTLCKNYVSFLKTLPLVTTPGKPKKGDALRVNDRFSIEDWGFAERLWRETGLKEVLLDGGGGEEEEEDREREGRRELWYVA
jgi:hypothetical protein